MWLPNINRIFEHSKSLKNKDMKNLSTQITEETKKYGITLKNSLVTYGTIILYCISIDDVLKLKEVLSTLKAEIVCNEQDLTVGLIF